MRGYGKACLRCRQKKRRCLTNTDAADGSSCVQCARDGVPCQVYSKRARGDHNEPRTDGRGSSASTGAASPSTFASSPRAALAHPHMHSSSTRAHPLPIAGPQGVGAYNLSTSPRDIFAGSGRESAHHRRMSQTSPYSYEHAATNTVLTPANEADVDAQLLATYFTWQCPQLYPVREELFRRESRSECSSLPGGLASHSGPYYSPLLHAAICDQASRHLGHLEQLQGYTDRSTAHLMPAILGPPDVPTVQALLIMAGRKLALGDAHAGWLFSGMAFRMLADLDIDLGEGEGAEEGDEAGMMGRQFFWSAYCWDK